MKLALLSLWMVAAAGCTTFSPQPDPSRFFTLSPLSRGQETARQNNDRYPGMSLGIGPVSLPGYLDRQEIVTRIAPNQLRLSEFDRWAEPLDESIARVVSQNLATLLRAERISPYPWPVDRRPLYQVEIEVLRFETNTVPEAQVAARWTLRNAGRKDLVRYRDTQLTRPAGDRTAAGAVAALSEALAEFSQQIAAAIEEMDRAGK